jgi:cyclopropane fatty-acyl-phospholipid synthase-like methyltransferase
MTKMARTKASKKADLKAMMRNGRFPRSAKYDPAWQIANEMGPNALWLTEALCETMDLQPGMRVLDMGCGRAMSSIFLAKEFGVQVWANDLWIGASDNWKRIREAGVEKSVFPIHADGHALPFANEFFDAVVSLDSYHYYGTDDLYLSCFVRFVKPGGQLGVVMPGLMRELGKKMPAHLTKKSPSGGRFWAPSECFSFHTARWWRRHWEQTELVDVERADTLEDGWRDWLQFEKVKVALKVNRHDDEAPVLEADRGRWLGFVRMVARRKNADA